MAGFDQVSFLEELAAAMHYHKSLDARQRALIVDIGGGTSRSPRIKARAQACFPGIPLVQGDPSLGVVSGLAVAASEAGG